MLPMVSAGQVGDTREIAPTLLTTRQCDNKTCGVCNNTYQPAVLLLKVGRSVVMKPLNPAYTHAHMAGGDVGGVCWLIWGYPEGASTTMNHQAATQQHQQVKVFFGDGSHTHTQQCTVATHHQQPPKCLPSQGFSKAITSFDHH